MFYCEKCEEKLTLAEHIYCIDCREDMDYGKPGYCSECGCVDWHLASCPAQTKL